MAVKIRCVRCRKYVRAVSASSSRERKKAVFVKTRPFSGRYTAAAALLRSKKRFSIALISVVFSPAVFNRSRNIATEEIADVIRFSVSDAVRLLIVRLFSSALVRTSLLTKYETA